MHTFMVYQHVTSMVILGIVFSLPLNQLCTKQACTDGQKLYFPIKKVLCIIITVKYQLKT